MIRNYDIDQGRFEFSPLQVLGVVVNYFCGYQYLYPKIGVWISGSKGVVTPRVAMFIYLFTLLTTVFIVRKELWASFRYFKRSIRTNIGPVFRIAGALLLFNIAIGLIVQLIMGDGTVSANQAAVNDGLRNFPFLNMFATIIFAPIVEEIVFRGAFYQALRSEKAYKSSIFISCLLFGLIHIVPSMAATGDLTQLVYLIPYSGMAIFMILAFEVTGSIWGAIFVHMLNNAFATLTVILPMFLG